jgi:hypothetical protein
MQRRAAARVFRRQQVNEALKWRTGTQKYVVLAIRLAQVQLRQRHESFSDQTWSRNAVAAGVLAFDYKNRSGI